jgi:mannose-6-phosphate isomerase-like protein (cupin superfamily)
MKAGKVWGITEAIFANGAFELHRIEATEGGICSEHRHAHKWNGFYVEKGMLEITIWRNSGTIDRLTMQPGDTTIVPPGEYHQFRALSDAVAFEFYWAAPLNPDDIERRTIGFQGSSSGRTADFDSANLGSIPSP